MAVHIKPGEVYDASRVRMGDSSNGKWELIVIKDEKGKKEITVWASNPEVEILEGGKVKILSIDEAVSAARKDQNGTWKDSFSINATVERVASDSSDFEELADGELAPWDMENELPL